MRGMDEMQEPLFTTVKLEDFVPADHPLRPLRLLVNQALKRLNGLFGTIYADSGRASIAPEKLLRALLLQVFYCGPQRAYADARRSAPTRVTTCATLCGIAERAK